MTDSANTCYYFPSIVSGQIMKKISLVCLVVLLAAGAVLAQAAPDPIRLATGARILGMGKAFAGLSDDISSFFINPAGLANPLRWQVTSMSGKLLEEFNYLSFSGLYPTELGNFGLAYAGSSIGGAFATTIEAGSDPDDPIYVIDYSQDPMSYYNNLLLLSYALKLEQISEFPLLSDATKRFPLLKDINVGANLKFFSVNLTGDGITQGNASGNELDLGIQGPTSYPWLTWGATIQNALTTAMGGKLVYQSGWEEHYPALLKVGLATNIIGRKNALYGFEPHTLKFLIDLDYELSRSTLPPIYHLGLEWEPMELVAIRVGIDQEMVTASNIANNLTTGVGLTSGDFRFDYAYHQFYGAPGVDNHFFSLSYGISPAERVKDHLISAPDKLTTTLAAVDVEGAAVDPRITDVRINKIKVALSARAEFKTQTSLNVGKNVFVVEGYDNKGKLIEADKLRMLRLINYPDVPSDYWAAEQIGYIGTLGIIKGYPDGSFKPKGNITRAELSALLIRTQVGGDDKVPSDVESSGFKDIPSSHFWAAKYIDLAAKSKIVTGYPDGTFRPSANITRAEGLTMIARFGQVEKATYSGEFTDIPFEHWAAPIIAGANNEGMLVYLKGELFEPNRLLTRAEAVEMLYRSQPVMELIGGLANFESGY